MNPPPRHAATSFQVAGILLLIAAVFAAWANSFAGPFVFDDLPSLLDNPSIHQLSTGLFPPGGGLTVSGRPVLNLTFALNYALSREAVGSYHAVNLGIHLLAALTLFGLIRRTLRLPALAPRCAADADWLALAITLLWAVHPLQTESVTYIVQRAESLAGLFYLLTLYCFSRSASSAHPARWFAASAASCLLGALTKESTATAPLLVLLYDRTFVSGSFRGAWLRHRSFHVALMTNWLVLAGLVFATANRGGTTGFGTPVAAWQYALIQLHAVAHYLRLSFWPHPLVFDYGPFQAVPVWPVVAGAALVVPGVLLTAWALWRCPVLGFPGAWFFLQLAPSSSLVPIASQIMAEHRIYLALAGVVTLAVLALRRCVGKFFPWVFAILALASLFGTVQRNTAYASPLDLWTRTSDDFPSNPRANLNLGQCLANDNRWTEAARQFEAALGLQPNYVAAHYNLALVYTQMGRLNDASTHFAFALRLNPDLAEAAYDWGTALANAGRAAEAIGKFQHALRLDPNDARFHYNLGNALVTLGRAAEAIPHYRTAVRLAPIHANAHFNLANALFEAGRAAEAATEYETVLRLTPGDPEATRSLALAREAVAETADRR